MKGFQTFGCGLLLLVSLFVIASIFSSNSQDEILRREGLHPDQLSKAPNLSDDQKHFFWATAVVKFSDSPVEVEKNSYWLTKYLLEQNMSDTEFQAFMKRQEAYGRYVKRTLSNAREYLKDAN